MAEEKILIPTYKRSGKCGRCGADIYAAEVKQKGWPLMSACACEHGPKIASLKRAVEQNRRSEPETESQAQAA